MRHTLCVCLLALVAFAPLQAEDGATKSVRAVFWNIAWFPGGEPEASAPQAVDQIVKVVPAMAALAPDILGVCEVLNEQAIDISLYKTPGVTTQVCSAFLDEKTGLPTRQQIGIASRLPAMSAWWEEWKPSKANPKRGFTFAAFQPVPGHTLLVYTVHLKSNRGDEKENFAMREESSRQLLDHVAAMEKAYAVTGKVSVIIGGDFNTSLDDPKFTKEKSLIDLQKAGFVWCWEGIPFKDRVTLPSEPSKNPNYPPFPDTCFDHVFAKNVKLRSARVEVVEGKPSDHRPVVVELDFPSPSPSGPTK